jgi:hypothetical protein
MRKCTEVESTYCVVHRVCRLKYDRRIWSPKDVICVSRKISTERKMVLKKFQNLNIVTNIL